MKILVTGGGGFLGSRICERLHARGDTVVALGRGHYSHLVRQGINTVQVDLRDAGAVQRAFRGQDAVIHAGALPGIWGKTQDFWETNVGGTRNVLDACRTSGVPKLVHTSSPSVVFGDAPLCGVDESQPYPAKHLAPYPASKAAAERMVLAANGLQIATLALRPHLIFGPGDPHLFPRIIERARNGRLLQVGEGTNLVDITYIDNAADAHLLALDALHVGARCSGKAYFISQGSPVCLWPWLNDILERVGVTRVARRMSYGMAWYVGTILEIVYGMLRSANEPAMTRFLASQLATSHYFDVSAAQSDLGYHAQVTTQEGVERLVEWLRRGTISAG